jgi:hypothetical protein
MWFLWGITFIKYRCVLLCIVLIVVSSVEGGGGCVGVVPTFSKWFFDDFLSTFSKELMCFFYICVAFTAVNPPHALKIFPQVENELPWYLQLSLG